MQTSASTQQEIKELSKLAQPARSVRPLIVDGDSPEPPYPLLLSGLVQRGFGRGGKDLGCPTANLPDECLPPIDVLKTGVYYGFAQVSPPEGEEQFMCMQDVKVLPMVMSLGWNPFYKNERLTAEVHLLHEFGCDFYGHNMKTLVLGYIRPELDYTSREALIADIEIDKLVAINSLNRPEYQKYRTDPTYFDLES